MFLLARRMFKESYLLGPIYQRHQNREIEFRLVFETQCSDQRTEMNDGHSVVTKLTKTRRTVSKKAVLNSGVNYLNKNNPR